MYILHYMQFVYVKNKIYVYIDLLELIIWLLSDH